jgi:Rrf2 family iron-sulfur cluster assembly transcriptional regulator
MRLELRARTELALRALRALSDGRRRRVAEVADTVGSTPAYMAHVMTDLSRRGWVESAPGPTGGHSLAVHPRSITLLDLIEAVEGPTDDGRCVMIDRPCPSPEPCVLHDVWMDARDALMTRLAATTLDEFMSDQEVNP